MPIIVFCSPKGGCGKTTAATLLATELAENRTTVEVIDGDPNRNITDWARLPGVPAGLVVSNSASPETIADDIDDAQRRAAFVIVDLEGTANAMAATAIGLADFVVIPLQGSHLDAKQAARQVQLVRQQARVARRTIPYAVLFTRTSPAILPRTQRHIQDRFSDGDIAVFETRLCDREAYRAIFSYGGTLTSLDAKAVSNIDGAIANARAFVDELLAWLRRKDAEVA